MKRDILLIVLVATVARALLFTYSAVARALLFMIESRPLVIILLTTLFSKNCRAFKLFYYKSVKIFLDNQQLRNFFFAV
jgi:hypothetical protein